MLSACMWCESLCVCSAGQCRKTCSLHACGVNSCVFVVRGRIGVVAVESGNTKIPHPPVGWKYKNTPSVVHCWSYEATETEFHVRWTEVVLLVLLESPGYHPRK